MSCDFETADLVMLVPKDVCAQTLLNEINSVSIVEKENEEAPDSYIGAINVHVFKYSSFTDIANCTNAPFALLIAMSSAEFSTEIEYSDYLNEIVGKKAYTVLSISDLHKVPTEQSKTDNRTRMIRGNNIAQSVNGILGKWFRDRSYAAWKVMSSMAVYCCSKVVVVKTRA